MWIEVKNLNHMPKCQASPTLLSPHLQWHLTFTWRLAPPHIEWHVGIKTSAITTCCYFIRNNICIFWWFQLVQHVALCGVIRYYSNWPNTTRPDHWLAEMAWIKETAENKLVPVQIGLNKVLLAHLITMVCCSPKLVLYIC